MCNQHHWHEDDTFGFLVDAPAIRGLIDEVRRHAELDDAAERIERLKPAFAGNAFGMARISAPANDWRHGWRGGSGV